MRVKPLFSFVAVIITPMVLVAGAGAQAVSLQDQLAAQYKLAKVGSDSSGYSVTEEGTLLTVQKAGIVGVPYKNVTQRTATYQDGTVHVSDPTTGKGADWTKRACGLIHKCPTTPDAVKDETTTHLLKVGDKVYPTRLDVNADKDTVTMAIVACDSCNNTDPPIANKAQVIFQFPKGSLAKASAGDVEDTMGQLLAISNDAQKAQGGEPDQHSAQQAAQDQQPEADAAPASPSPPPQGKPQSIEQGMTPDQVAAALGKPEKIVTIGTKQLYVYKDIKVTFLNGKVSDVE